MHSEPLNILIVDDNSVDREIYKRYINGTAAFTSNIHEVATAEEAITFVAKHQTDCILLDYNLPDSNGIEVIKQLNEKTYRLPIIMLTGQEYDDIAVKAIEQGAQDYLRKSQHSLERLWLSILNAIEKTNLLKELDSKSAALEELAFFDQLTKLHNRTSFSDVLKKALAAAIRHEHLLALLFIDLDNFKNVNDTLGHNIGDQLLALVAERIRSTIRLEDHVGRIGGDEFAVLLTQIKSSNDGAVVAEKIIKTIEPPYHIYDNIIHIGASIGIANFPMAGTDPNTLAKSADIAMYRAKAEGKNTYQFYSEKLNIKQMKRISFENALRNAIQNNEFYIDYQPQYNVFTQQLTGLEALLRWENETLGLIMPNEFIPIAEETGLIVPIGDWVLKTACEQYVHWRKKYAVDFAISVNISPRHLKNPNFISKLKRVIAKHKIKPNTLELELTETAIMSDLKDIEDTIKTIHELGVRISIDDFGTGYSSLSRLKNLPISALKVDRTFIKCIEDSQNDAIITKSILSLGKNLQIDVIAEGVETKAQYDFLLDNHCELAQGFYFDRPLNIEAINTLLQKSA